MPAKRSWSGTRLLFTSPPRRATSSTGKLEGFFFSLFRSAGEPGKDYKDELLKVAESLK